MSQYSMVLEIQSDHNCITVVCSAPQQRHSDESSPYEPSQPLHLTLLLEQESSNEQYVNKQACLVPVNLYLWILSFNTYIFMCHKALFFF